MTKRHTPSPGRSLVFALIATTLPAVARVAAAEAQDWTTEAEFEIGGRPDARATLWHVRQVRVTPDGSRVYVVEGQGYGNQPDRGRRATAWLPDGSLLAAIDSEGETGDLGVPIGIRLARDGFRVRYESVFALFSDDGALVETIAAPRTEVGRSRVEGLAVLEDRSLIGITRISMIDDRLGWLGGEPVLDDHVLHVSQTGDGWSWDTIADLDRRNQLLGLRDPNARGPVPDRFYRGQPFSDTDLFYLDPVSGIVGVVTRNGAPGAVEVHEITVRGDTTWRRRIELPPLPIPAEELQEAVEDVADGIKSGQAPERGLARLPLDTLRRMARDALHLPSHRPPVTAAIATASGELWLRSAESSDTVIVWYALRRGDTNRPPRRVVVPAWFRLADATNTHVWGFRTYDNGAAQVFGRRLVPPG